MRRPARPRRPRAGTAGRALRAACLAAALAIVPAHAASLLHYTARLRGVAFFEATYCLRLDPATYDAHLTARTLGLAEFLFHGRVDGHAQGGVAGNRLVPQGDIEHGRLSGQDYDLSIAYPGASPGGAPVVTRITPPATVLREPVPQSALAGAMDGLSAIVLESLVVTRTGACQGGALVYDGRQLRRLTTHTAGQDVLVHSGRSVFAGPALRCDTTSEMLAGFVKDEPRAGQARPRFSKAWLARMAPDGPAVPVRFAFDADMLGDIFVDLDSSGTCDAPPPQAPQAAPPPPAH